MGARFAKWRAVIKIGYRIRANSCIKSNAHALARYAGLFQEVKPVEPEVLMDGSHTIQRYAAVTREMTGSLFSTL